MTEWVPAVGSDLTDDELDALRCVAHGMSHQRAAALAGMKLRAWEKRLYRVRARLGADNTVHAVYLACQKGWIQ
jgi:DNA-binding CsgD family transcriptional regulator